MGKIVMIAGTAIVMFALSAVGSWVLNKPSDAAVDKTEAESGKDSKSENPDSENSSNDPMMKNVETESDEPKIPEPLPPFDPKDVPVTELLEHYQQLEIRSKQLDEKAIKLQEKEKHLKQMENAIKFTEEKVGKMLEESREIREETVLTLLDAEEKLKQAEASEQKVAADLAKKAPEIDQAEVTNATTWAKYLEGLEPAKAAEILKGLADEHGVAAIKPILDAITARKAAAIVGELQTLDKSITEQLFALGRTVQEAEE